MFHTDKQNICWGIGRTGAKAGRIYTDCRKKRIGRTFAAGIKKVIAKKNSM